MTKKKKGCRWGIPWVGRCNESVAKDGFCKEHKNQKCAYEDSRSATKGCPVAGSWVCGIPICNRHEECPSHAGVLHEVLCRRRKRWGGLFFFWLRRCELGEQWNLKKGPVGGIAIKTIESREATSISEFGKYLVNCRYFMKICRITNLWRRYPDLSANWIK